ncbi:MAG: FAD-dependent thymidylate synthase, partial [Halobacteriota archaeon]
PSVDDPDWVGRNQLTGSVDQDTADERSEIYREAVEDSLRAYAELVERGLPPEDARFVLPIGTRTNVVMSVNARTLMHIADMRAAADAQWEIRSMTQELLDIAAEWCPITFEIYREEMMNRKNRLAP